MNIDPTIPGGGESFPLFAAGKNSFYYRVDYFVRNISHSIQYNSVHELILNLCCFQDHDTVTYVSREDGGNDFITTTLDQFKVTVSGTLYSSTHDNLELLYLRLLLVNQYSQFISDRGRFRQLDFTLRKYLTTIRGGIDSYLSYENRHVILYLKYRRLSSIHLLTTIIDRNDHDDIHINHINIPNDIPNRGLFEEALKLHIPKSKFRLYNYDPIPGEENDHIVARESNITSSLIQLFNQLLK